jgi:hypothetical protein
VWPWPGAKAERRAFQIEEYEDEGVPRTLEPEAVAAAARTEDYPDADPPEDGRVYRQSSFDEFKQRLLARRVA